MTQRRTQQHRALAAAKRLALTIEGIRGVDLGYASRDGVKTPQLAVRFHIATKRGLSDLQPTQVLPKKLLGIPCDVLQARYELHATNPRLAREPIVPGISIGNLGRQTTGTLGGIVQDRNGAPCILSNWHVLYGAVDAQAGEAIIQPGPRHLTTVESRTIAHLTQATDLAHGYDAALATIDKQVAVDPKPLDLALTIQGTTEPTVGMRVVKSSAISGVTYALVDGIGGTFLMDYTSYGDTSRWMDGLRLVPDPAHQSDEISLNGDSGALWIEETTGRACALHFGGEDGLGPLAEYAVAHPLQRVLQLLDATVPGGS